MTGNRSFTGFLMGMMLTFAAACHHTVPPAIAPARTTAAPPTAPRLNPLRWLPQVNSDGLSSTRRSADTFLSPVERRPIRSHSASSIARNGRRREPRLLIYFGGARVGDLRLGAARAERRPAVRLRTLEAAEEELGLLDHVARGGAAGAAGEGGEPHRPGLQSDEARFLERDRSAVRVARAAVARKVRGRRLGLVAAPFLPAPGSREDHLAHEKRMRGPDGHMMSVRRLVSSLREAGA